MDALARQVQAAVIKGPVLADDRLDLVVLAGQAIYYQPFEYTQMYTAGIWDITSFQRRNHQPKIPSNLDPSSLPARSLACTHL